MFRPAMWQHAATSPAFNIGTYKGVVDKSDFCKDL